MSEDRHHVSSSRHACHWEDESEQKPEANDEFDEAEVRHKRTIRTNTLKQTCFLWHDSFTFKETRKLVPSEWEEE